MALDWRDVSSNVVAGVLLAMLGAVMTGVAWLAREAIKRRWIPMSIWLFILLGAVVGAATGAIAYVAYKRMAPSTQLQAVIDWDKFEEVERSNSGWVLRAWLDLTNRSDRPMVLSFDFRLTNEQKQRSFPRFFRVRASGADTNTIEIAPFGHKLIVLEITQDSVSADPVDMGDAQRQYWIDVADRVSGLKITLQPGQHYEVGAENTQNPLPLTLQVGSDPSAAPPAAAGFSGDAVPVATGPPSTESNSKVGEGAASRLGRGWTVQKKPNGWWIYLIIDAAPLDPATRLAIATDPVPLPAEYLPLAHGLHTALRQRIASPRLVENELGVLPRQEVTEHIVHTVTALSDVLQCSYEIFRDGNNITPDRLPTSFVRIAELSDPDRDAVKRLDDLMHQMVRERHATALAKSSK